MSKEIEIKVNVIKEVIPLYPEIASEEFKHNIIVDYNSIQEIKEIIYQHREEIRALEETLKLKEKDFANKSTVCEIIYETKIVESAHVDDDLKVLLHRKGKIY